MATDQLDNGIAIRREIGKLARALERVTAVQEGAIRNLAASTDFNALLSTGHEYFLGFAISAIFEDDFPGITEGRTFRDEALRLLLTIGAEQEEAKRSEYAQELADKVLIPFYGLLGRLWRTADLDRPKLVVMAGKLSTTDSQVNPEWFVDKYVRSIAAQRKLPLPLPGPD